MHLFIALGLLIACGIVDATFYNPRSQILSQLMERRQRSIPIPYSYGYHYNPIEPSINVLDSLSEGLDSRINTFHPIYKNIKMSTHDVNSVPRTHSYQSKNPVYDSEYISLQDIPSLFPEEDSVDYKYPGSHLSKYLTRPPTTESDIAINLVAIKKTAVFGYGFPTYKSRYSSDSVWNFGSKIPNTIFEDYQSVESSDPKTFEVSSPTVTIVELLPETLEQESTITTTKNPLGSLLENLLSETQNEVKNSVEDELNYEITQKTPTEDESNPITSEKSQTSDQSIILEENPTEDESNSITIEETQTEDESNYIITESTQFDDESNAITTEKTLTEDNSNSITTEETLTEDESNSLQSKENPIKNEFNFRIIGKYLTEDISNSIATEGIQTEDESNSITTEETQAEDELNSPVFNSITTEENQTEDDESKSKNSQETFAFKLNDAFDKNRYSKSDEYIQLKIKNLLKNYEKLEEQYVKSQFEIVDNITEKPQSNLSKDENTSQKIQPELVNISDSYEEY